MAPPDDHNADPPSSPSRRLRSPVPLSSAQSRSIITNSVQLATTVTHKIIPWHHHHEHDDQCNRSHGASKIHSIMNEANFGHIVALQCGVVLTSTLAWFSGLDAKNQCISKAAYDYYDMLDNEDDLAVGDYERMVGGENCVKMMKGVVTPVCVSVIALSLLSILLLVCRKPPSTPEGVEIPEEYRNVEHRQRYKHDFCICLLLSLISPFILLSWSYGLYIIMMHPRGKQDGNPYQSLAAVDNLGQIGDNANLYYTSWFSTGLSVAIFYETTLETLRAHKRKALATPRTGDHNAHVEAIISLSTSQIDLFQSKKATWYNSVYKLRARTGMWVAALAGTVTILASSLRINENLFAQIGTCTDQEEEDAVMCYRTQLSTITGAAASLLSFLAIAMHSLARLVAARFSEEHTPVSVYAREKLMAVQMPLRSEFVLSVILAFCLGVNAILATGVRGPAAAVGNLYYASWLSFLFCLRISVGCLEEICEVEDEEMRVAQGVPEVEKQTSETSDFSFEGDFERGGEKERANRLRQFAALSVFSILAMCAAVDAAVNVADGELTRQERYVVICPAVVAALSFVTFILCLISLAYKFVSMFAIGGTLSIILFALWVADLVITMHSEKSWAVNAIGDIKMANLYYFTWASTVTAGYQMTTYIKARFGLKKECFMVAVWAALGKICFVILGAGTHIWYNIRASCASWSAATPFCKRSRFAVWISVVGMAVSALIVLSRMAEPFCISPTARLSRIRARVEATISVALVALFGVAVAVITGIGGPGQSVGDLYYSTWLAFLVTIGIGLSCFEELYAPQPEVPIGSTNDSSYKTQTPFVSMS